MPKLTAEERRALKAQKKRDRKLRLAEQKRQVKRDHLHREVKYDAHTVKVYEKNWREMLLKVAVPRMHQELEFAWHNFERCVDAKDFTISLLMDELKDAEEQCMLNFRSHLENLELLMRMFEERMDELYDDYEMQLRNLRDRWDEEVQGMRDGTNENFELLKTILYGLEVARKEQDRMIRAEYYSKLDEVEVKNQLGVQKLRASLETKYQNLFDQTSNFIQDFNKQIKDRKKEQNQLKTQDDSMQMLIGKQFNKMKYFFETIRQLKQKYSDMKQMEDSKLMDLQAERQYFSNTFITLKLKMESDRKNDLAKLMQLSDYCQQTFTYLERLNRKGEFLMKMAAVCRKLETQREKILPFPRNNVGLLPGDEKKRDDDDELKCIRMELELFWQRCGQAAGVKYMVDREKKFLIEENEIYLDSYEEYCEEKQYPKIVVYKKPFGHINKVDANMEMKKYSK